MTQIVYVYNKDPTTPRDVTGFRISYNPNGTSTLSWNPEVVDPDMSHYVIRHSSAVINAAWANSQILIDKVPANITSYTVPSLPGTYLIKAVDFSGFESTNAIGVVAQDTIASNVVLTLDEASTGFQGSKLNCYVDAGNRLALNGNDLSSWNQVSDVNNISYGSPLGNIFTDGAIEPTQVQVSIDRQSIINNTSGITTASQVWNNSINSAYSDSGSVYWEIDKPRGYLGYTMAGITTAPPDPNRPNTYISYNNYFLMYLVNGLCYSNLTALNGISLSAVGLDTRPPNRLGIRLDLDNFELEYYLNGISIVQVTKLPTLTQAQVDSFKAYLATGTSGGTPWTSGKAVTINQLVSGPLGVYQATTAGTLGTQPPDFISGAEPNGTAVLTWYSPKIRWRPMVSNVSSGLSNYYWNLPTIGADFTLGRLPSNLSFSRASTKVYCNSQGYLATAPINTPVFPYDPTTLAIKGLLIEGGYTNNVLNNQDLTAASFTKTNTTVSQDIDPFGLLSNCVVNSAIGTGLSCSVSTTGGTSVVGQFCATKVFLKPYEITKVRLSVTVGVNSLAYTLDLANLTSVLVSSTLATAGTPFKCFPLVKYTTTGWVEVDVATLSNTAGAVTLSILLLDSVGGATITSTTSLRLGVYGVQCIHSPTNPGTVNLIPSGAVVGTSSSDVCTLNTGHNKIYSGDSVGIHTGAELSHKILGQLNPHISLSDGTITNRTLLFNTNYNYGNADSLAAYISQAGVTVASPVVNNINTAIDNSAYWKIVPGAVGVGKSTFYQNGANLVSNTSPAVSALSYITQVAIGSEPSTGLYLNGCLRFYYLYNFDPLGTTNANAPSLLGSPTMVTGPIKYPITANEIRLFFDPSQWKYPPLYPSVPITNGIKSFGYYEFPTTVDLGTPVTSSVTSTISYNANNVMNLVSTWLNMANLTDLAGTNAKDVSAQLEVKYSTDNITWTPWQRFYVGNLTARYLKFRLALNSIDLVDTPLVDTLSVVVDMPDIIQSGTNIGGLAPLTTYNVVFNSNFTTIPAIAITGYGMQTGDYFSITSKTISGFTISFFNNSSSPVARAFDWTAKGY